MKEDNINTNITNTISSLSNELEQNKLSCSDCIWFEQCEKEGTLQVMNLDCGCGTNVNVNVSVCDDYYSIYDKLDNDEYIDRLIEQNRQLYWEEFNEYYIREWE